MCSVDSPAKWQSCFSRGRGSSASAQKGDDDALLALVVEPHVPLQAAHLPVLPNMSALVCRRDATAREVLLPAVAVGVDEGGEGIG